MKPNASRREKVLERRFWVRTPLMLDVHINGGGAHPAGTRPVSIKTRDISLGGLFVPITDPALSMLTSVEAVLMLDGEDQPTPHALRTEVARVTPDGVGLRFVYFNSQTYRTLASLLYPEGI